MEIPLEIGKTLREDGSRKWMRLSTRSSGFNIGEVAVAVKQIQPLTQP
jgi:hypothetical protein